MVHFELSYSSLVSRLAKTPALTVGYVIFTFILLIVDTFTSQLLTAKFALFPGAPLHFDLNRLSFYLLFHTDLLHWGFNMLAIFTFLSKFEETHGTIYTGITLNLVTVVLALQYCLVGFFLYPDSYVTGTSGVFFALYTYFAYKEHKITPVLHTFTFQNRECVIKTIYSPFIILLVSFIVFPRSSFWGHLFGITTGFALALGYIKILYPPSKIVLYIERKLDWGISRLGKIVSWYGEEESIDVRGVSYKSFLWSEETEEISQGEGRVLGGFTGEARVLGV